MQMYMFFLKIHNIIKIITILNNNCMPNEYVIAEKNIPCRFFEQMSWSFVRKFLSL